MMRIFKIKKKMMLVAILVMATSCRQEESTSHVVKIDVPDIELSAIDDFFFVDTIPLETTVSSLIGVVSRVQFVDDKMLVGDFVNGKLSVFSKEGRFISNIGKKGQGPEEYTNIHDFFVKNDTLNVYDFNRKKILQYSIDGTFFKQKDVEAFSFDRIVPANKDNGYVALGTFSNKKENPKFGWLDNDFQLIKASTEQRQNGVSLPNMFFADKDRIIYWEMMNNVIETDSLLSFTFVHNLCTYWTIYDKENHKSAFFRLAKNGEMDKLQYVSAIHDGSFVGVYFPDNLRTDDNPSIIKLKHK